MKEYKFISFGNYFDENDEDAKRICEALEAGETVHPSCACIGHTRAYTEELKCHRFLEQKYGDRLILADPSEYKCAWGNLFKLKEVAK